MDDRIAIIGWGSLIWDQGNLKISSERWSLDGPRLPVEFIRKSSNGRITLVICDKYLDNPDIWVKTYWNYSTLESLETARIDLRKREGTPDIANIGFYYQDQCSARNDRILNIIRKWAKEKGLIGVIWTDFGSKRNLETSNVIPYLRTLQGGLLTEAKCYIEKAPLQIRTPLRKEIQDVLGWIPTAQY